VILFSAYIFIAQPVYRAESYLLPPSKQVIQGLLVEFQDVEPEEETYSPDLVFAEFLRNLKSQGMRRRLFDNNNLIAHYSAGLSGK